jgi:heme oxygenase (biliverdin-IX-beta and delta-forming)
MITEHLKDVTRSAHAELEKLVIERIRRANTPAGYLHLLDLFYGFYKPVEERIDRFIDHTHFPDFPQRRKAASLVQDMHEMNSEGSGMMCEDLPQISRPSESIGALYVLEGSTLGGGIICKLLKKEMGDDAPQSFLFFNSYGEATMEMWMKFKDRINSYSGDAAMQRQMADAANATFIKFKNWINWYERNR